MSDPVRWLDDGGGSTGRERDVLRAGLDVEPPAESQAKVWTGLMLQLGPPGGPGGGPGGPSGGALPTAGGAAAAAKAAGALGLAGIVKAMIVGGVSAGIFVAGYAAVVPAPPPVSVQAAIQQAGAQPEAQRGASPSVPMRPSNEQAPARADAPRPATPAPATAPNELRTAGADAPNEGAPARAEPPAAGEDGMSAGSTPADVAAAERTTRLREERRMLEEARDALRRGDAPGALSRLEQARARFPGGVLVQEREALVIEALYRSGQRAAASARAAAFLRAYPMSPHAARIQSFVQ